jgi:hypothetical protein
VRGTRGPDDDKPARHTSRSRGVAESKLRRDGRHCPVCLKALPRIAGKGLARKCTSCEAQPEPARRCARCHEEAIWETNIKAACQACGNHGSKLRVVAGALTEES